MKVLSLFDGMSCGMLAMLEAGVKVDRYVAYEIDKYAVRTSSHNFPMIEQRGDVFQADFTEFAGFDWLVGGSPCTYWSIAQTKNRETVASGMGWELFSQYIRALHEAKPKYFIYENNKSMSKAIRESITETFSFEPICINSALVSAQNRQRLYWVGKRNDDGTYSKVPVEQPEDRGILLRDILETGEAWREKAYTLKAQYYKNGIANFVTNGGYSATGVAEPVNVTAECKAQCLRATYYKDGIRNMVGNTVDRKTCVAEPVRIGTIENDAKNPTHDSQQYRVYSPDGKGVTLCGNGGGLGAKTGLYAVPTPIEYSPLDNCDVVITDNNIRCSYKDGSGTAMGYSIYFDDVKSPTVISGHAAKMKIIERVSDKNQYPVYEVRNGLITIKGKQYPIKLKDGYYIIRKLTVRECMRLQTVPEWYEFPVSDSQAYKMLGNGWTVDVIAHILKGLKETKKIPDINEPMCIPITNITFGRGSDNETD